MDSLLIYELGTDLSNTVFSTMLFGFTMGCLCSLFGWGVGWFFNLVSKAF